MEKAQAKPRNEDHFNWRDWIIGEVVYWIILFLTFRELWEEDWWRIVFFILVVVGLAVPLAAYLFTKLFRVRDRRSG